jgi:hypothetical protein
MHLKQIGKLGPNMSQLVLTSRVLSVLFHETLASLVLKCKRLFNNKILEGCQGSSSVRKMVGKQKWSLGGVNFKNMVNIIRSTV